LIVSHGEAGFSLSRTGMGATEVARTLKIGRASVYRMFLAINGVPIRPQTHWGVDLGAWSKPLASLAFLSRKSVPAGGCSGKLPMSTTSTIVFPAGGRRGDVPFPFLGFDMEAAGMFCSGGSWTLPRIGNRPQQSGAAA
jgi:hypothetical protein